MKGSSKDNDAQIGCQCWCSDFLSSLTNFAIQYNYACASIATKIMLSHNDLTGEDVEPDFPEPRWAHRYMLSIVFVGSIAGMLVMGPLGDVIGIQPALVVTSALTVSGALISALCSWGDGCSIWTIISFGRFVLGVGVGGAYPLSAAKAALSAKTVDTSGGGGVEGMRRTVQSFFWQGPGSLTPYIAAMVLLQLPHQQGVTSVQFRCLLGFGAIPALTVAVMGHLRERKLHKVGKVVASDEVSADQSKGSALALALREPRYWKSLVGTAGTWFLLDVVLYSVVIFSPNVLVHVFGKRASLMDVAFRAGTIQLVGMCGAAVGITLVLLDRATPKALNVFGFALAGVFFAALAFVFAFQPDNSQALFALLCLLFFTLYSGPNVATFVMPVLAFPEEVRGTFGGLSSASGKVGAMIGALIFPILEDDYGIATVMALLAGVSVVGFFVSICCLQTAYDEEKASLTESRMNECDRLISSSSEESSSVDSTESLEPGGFCG